MYFSANANGEAEVIKVTLNPNPKKQKQNIFYGQGLLGDKNQGPRG